MATSAYVESLLGALATDTRKALKSVFDYLLVNLRLGRPDHQTRAENLQAYFLTGTTHAVADTEFSIEHGLSSAPYVLIPVLDLQTVGAKLVPLTVTRAADDRRIYLSSSETDAPIVLLVEAA